MLNKKYCFKFNACYIKDHPFTHLTDIPEEVAVAWVKNLVPDLNMGNSVTASELTINQDDETDASQNGWLNKLFVIVGHGHGKYIAIYKHDDRFAVALQND